MPRVAKGHIEQLPSGSFRVSVYAGTDPLTRRPIRLKSTVKTEQQAHIELGRLLKEASEGRTPESGATVAKLMDEYAAVAEWDVSTRQTNEGFIRRTIKPALGPMKVRKVRGPILDMLYAELKRCGDLSCTGKPFIEHRNVPVLAIHPRDRRPAWQQVTATLTEAIRSGILVPGDELSSITEVSALQGIGTGVIRHALEALAADGLIIVRHGRAAVVAGEPSNDPRLSRRRPGPGHDCRLAGCRPHVCHPMKPSTIRGIHSILSGAFAAAQRWEWTDRNPAESAKPPTTIRRPIPATSPDDVAKLIAEAHSRNAALGLYLWLVVVTGVRRGELCGLQIRDIDLDRGLVHVAFNYVVRGGQRVRNDTKTHQDRWLAIDPDTCALIATYLDEISATLAAVGVELRDDAYLFSNDPAHARPWNPDWVTHQIAAAADAAGVELDIKGGRHYTAGQLLAGGFDLRNTAARLGHSGGGATTLRRLTRSWYTSRRGGSPFRADMAEAGIPGTWESSTERVPMTPAIASRLGTEPGAAAMRTVYTFFGADEPVTLSVSWEPAALTSGTAIMFPEEGPHAGKGVVERMAVIGQQITHAEETVAARPALASEAERLRIRPGGIVLTIARIYRTEDRAVETADIIIPVERYSLVYDVPVC